MAENHPYFDRKFIKTTIREYFNENVVKTIKMFVESKFN